jgi:hypothetical protein
VTETIHLNASIAAVSTPTASIAVDSTPAPSTGMAPPAVAGLVCGCIGGIAFIILLVMLHHRWRLHHQNGRPFSQRVEFAKAQHTSTMPVMAHKQGSGWKKQERQVSWLPEDAGKWLNQRWSRISMAASMKRSYR